MNALDVKYVDVSHIQSFTLYQELNEQKTHLYPDDFVVFGYRLQSQRRIGRLSPVISMQQGFAFWCNSFTVRESSQHGFRMKRPMASSVKLCLR